MKKEKQKNHPEMPYERFLSHGKDALSNAELLAVLLPERQRSPFFSLRKDFFRRRTEMGRRFRLYMISAWRS